MAHDVKIVSLLLLGILISAHKCTHLDNKLTIVNNSNRGIYTYTDFAYPDTLLNGHMVTTSIIPPRGEGNHLISAKWESNVSCLKDSILIIVVLDTDTLQKYGWERVRKDYNILKRYDLTLEELETKQWKVTYP